MIHEMVKITFFFSLDMFLHCIETSLDQFESSEEDKQVATASYGHRYPRPARLKVASVEVSRAAALEGPMRRF